MTRLVFSFLASEDIKQKQKERNILVVCNKLTTV